MTRPDATDARVNAPQRLPALPAVGGQGHSRDVVALTSVRVMVWVSGEVQGVGFRWWTRCRALELGLVGSATNLPDGRVEVMAQGPRPACEELYRLLSTQPIPPVPPNAPRSYYRRPGLVTGAIVSWTPLDTPGIADEVITGFVER